MLVEGVAPVKLHDHDVGVFVLLSVKFIVAPLQIEVADAAKSATGAAPNEQVPAVSATIAVGPQELVIKLRVITSVPPASSLVATSVLRSVPLLIA